MDEEFQMETLYMCRICLQSSEDPSEMTSIFELDNSNMYLYQKIEKCGGIKIVADSDLPALICRKCNAFLTIAYKFRIICRHSDNYLREFIRLPQKDKKIEDSSQQDSMSYQDDVKIETSPLKVKNQSPPINMAYEEVDGIADTAEQWVNNEYDADTSIQKHKDNCTQPQSDISKSPVKTLGITSDGTAVICNKVDLQPITKDKNICDICGNSYSKKYALEAHMRRHRNERPHECEICHATFHLNFQLVRHIRTHTGARPYQCQYCKRCFSDRSSLVKHERIHRNERPYNCLTCGKSFTYSSVLKVHMLTHSGEKPYNCGICGKRFTRAHHLRAHLETQQHQNELLLKQVKPVEKFN